ncbi:hypothetical protein SAMN05192583_1383 [Sphingomonas gellani]|uniref:Uncharacterized protein n=1 Tax=Sphingomonas gellani TaxID=1166340 RepID=A0A1H8BIK2_9SPHN|nr:hypothetical protein [Sphingomonas gellani]SEM82642.1 hypothetical protein SAMN05192583_1383 [Sphingomonas gellani]
MPDHVEPRTGLHRFRRSRLALFGAGLVALGGVTGAVVTAQTRPSATMAPATPVPIRSMSSGSIVTIRGTVAEVYGNKFTMQDASGRALVDTGPEGDNRTLVTAGQPVTVQGHFDNGVMHGDFLVGRDGKVVALAPLGPPPGGPRPGPDRGPCAPPPPPPGAQPMGAGAPVPPPVAPPAPGATAAPPAAPNAG